MTQLYAVPAWLVLIVGVALAVVLACGGQTLIRRRFAPSEFIRHNEVAGFIVAVVGTLYGVMLGFVTITVWQEFDASSERVAQEAAAATDVWHIAEGLPEPAGSRIRANVVTYAHLMVEKEWPLMARGRNDPTSEALLTSMFHDVVTLQPANPGTANVQAAVISELSIVHDDRRRRLEDNGSGLSGFQWAILFVGAGVLVGFCYLFGLENARVQLMMTAAVATIIASLIILTFELDYPFRGDLGVGPGPWVQFLERLETPPPRR